MGPDSEEIGKNFSKETDNVTARDLTVNSNNGFYLNRPALECTRRHGRFSFQLREGKGGHGRVSPSEFIAHFIIKLLYLLWQLRRVGDLISI